MPIIPQLCYKTRKKQFAAFKMYHETTDFEQKWSYLAQKGPNKIFWRKFVNVTFICLLFRNFVKKTRKKRCAAFKMYHETTDFEQKWPYLDQKGPNKIFWRKFVNITLICLLFCNFVVKQEKPMRGFQDVSRNNRFWAKMAIFGSNKIFWRKFENVTFICLLFRNFVVKQEKSDERLSRCITKQPILIKNGDI